MDIWILGQIVVDQRMAVRWSLSKWSSLSTLLNLVWNLLQPISPPHCRPWPPNIDIFTCLSSSTPFDFTMATISAHLHHPDMTTSTELLACLYWYGKHSNSCFDEGCATLNFDASFPLLTFGLIQWTNCNSEPLSSHLNIHVRILLLSLYSMSSNTIPPSLLYICLSFDSSSGVCLVWQLFLYFDQSR